jgi:hypothetical protein
VWGPSGSPELWIGCDAGLVFMSSSGSFTLLLDATSVDVDTGINAVAVNPAGPVVAVGNGYHLWCVRGKWGRGNGGGMRGGACLWRGHGLPWSHATEACRVRQYMCVRHKSLCACVCDCWVVMWWWWCVYAGCTVAQCRP